MSQGQQGAFCAKRCQQFVEKQFMTSVLPKLQEYIAIQNVSRGFLKQQVWEATGWDQLLKAANLIKDWVENCGIKGLKPVEIHYKEKTLTPLLYIEVDGTLPETILFYGHYDKQPAFTGWNQELGLSAFKPVLYPDQVNPIKLYGRGGADDGYSTFGSILAIKALQDQNIPHPRCVFTIEGNQESGQEDVKIHITNLKDRIGHPKLVFCLDSGTLDYERLWATTSLRGYLGIKIKVSVLREGVHSGTSSGIVPNTFRILRSLLERLQDQQTGEMPSELNVNIPPNRYKEMYDVAQKLKEAAVHQFPFLEGVQRVNQDPLQSLINMGWRSQMVITSIEGYPPIAEAGNVMVPFTEAKISIRLPPTADVQKSIEFVRKTLTTNVPYNAIVDVDIQGGSGFDNAVFPAELEKAISGASTTFFGKEYLTIAEGGSIPFMGFLRGLWEDANFVVTGVLGPESNAHGPNEFLHIPYVKKLISSMAYIVAHTSQAK